MAATDLVKRVRLKIEDEEFECDKETLCLHSDYFAAMFSSQMSECQQDVITLQDVSEVAFQCIWNYCATGNIDLDIAMVADVMVTSQMLQFNEVHTICLGYLNENICAANCLTILTQASQLLIENLASIALSFICFNFKDITMDVNFKDVSVEMFEKVIQSSDLNIDSEMQVFEAVRRFLSQHESNTETTEIDFNQAAEKLFRHVRFSNLSFSRLCELLNDATVVKYNLKPKIQEIMSKKTAVDSHNTTTDSGKDGKSKKDKHSMKSLSKNDASCGDTAEETSSPKPSPGDTPGPKEREIVTRCYPHECVVAIPVVVSKKPKDSRVSVENEYWLDHRSDRNITKGILYRLETGSYELERLTDIPIPESTYGYQICSSGRYIYVVGGEVSLGSGKWIMDMWRYDGWTHEWTVVGQLDEPRRNHAVTADEHGNLYVAGGFSKYRQKSMTISKWIRTDRAWRSLPNLPVFIYQNTSLVTESTFYAFSGFHMNSLDLHRLQSTNDESRLYGTKQQQKELWKMEKLDMFLNEDQKELLDGIELPTGSMRHVIHGNKLYFIAEKVFSLDLATREVALVCDMSKVDVSDNLSQCIPELAEPFYYHIGHDVIARRTNFVCPQAKFSLDKTRKDVESMSSEQGQPFKSDVRSSPSYGQSSPDTSVSSSEIIGKSTENTESTSDNFESVSEHDDEEVTRDELLVLSAIIEKDRVALHSFQQCIDGVIPARKRVIRNLAVPESLQKGIQLVNVPRKITFKLI